MLLDKFLLTYYILGFIGSLTISIIFVFRWRKQFNIYLTIANVIIPILNLSYLMLAVSTTPEEALLATKFTYLGGCYLELLVFFMILRICKIKIIKPFALAIFIFNTILFVFVLTSGTNTYFYKSIDLEIIHGIAVLNKEKGIVHEIFLRTLTITMIIAILAPFFALYKKRNISLKTAGHIVFTQIITMISFLSSKWIPAFFNPVPFSYLLIQIIFQFLVERVSRNELGQTVFNSQGENETFAYFSTDFKYHFISANNLAFELFPKLKSLKIDKKIPLQQVEFKTFFNMTQELSDKNKTSTRIIEENDKFLKMTAGYLFDGKKNCGYQAVFQDVTLEQSYLNLMDNYNDKLKQEVDDKTRHIQDILNKLMLGMAVMVENRDFSTGGHIRRTSEVVRILMTEIMKENKQNFSQSFYQCMIKAAPLHDLGKIAVDDAILRKDGKFTDNEYAIMKTHAEKGAYTVHALLEGIADEEFARIAENVAHYHHERIDGSGYPMQLKGEEIPIEARIMAIADVYDALVSKRCYKEQMDFDEAFILIENGMGKQFDEQFNSAFIACRPKLEEFYTNYSLQHQNQIY